MRERHIALIVEDDKEIAQDLAEILSSIECNSVVVDNGEDAVAELHKKSFCLILLDLHIKSASESIKGHLEQGRALLRRIREKHGDHIGRAFWLPVIIVSGVAREFDDAVDVMKDGASDFIRKPINSRLLSDKIRQALQATGRQTHDGCQEPPKSGPNLKDDIPIAIPGDRIGRRTRITVASKPVKLTDSSLRNLLHLLVAKKKGRPVHKVELGAASETGFKGISNLRNELKPALGDLDIIENDHNGNYTFKPNVVIGGCCVDKLLQIGDRKISDLAKLLQDHAPTSVKKSEGNSETFPTQRRRRQK